MNLSAKMIDRRTSTPKGNHSYGPFFLEYSLLAEYNLLQKQKMPGVYVIPSYTSPLCKKIKNECAASSALSVQYEVKPRLIDRSEVMRKPQIRLGWSKKQFLANPMQNGLIITSYYSTFVIRGPWPSEIMKKCKIIMLKSGLAGKSHLNSWREN